MSAFIILLLVGLISLFLGCFLGISLHHSGWGLAALKGLTASFIGGLLLFHLLPDAYETSGALSLVAMALGFLTLILAERFLPHQHSEPTSGRYFTAELVWMGLLAHQATDGMALSLATRGESLDWNLALIVIAHQLPVAAIITYIFHIRHNSSGSWLRILGMAAATIMGALFQKSLTPFLSSQASQLFLAFIAGSFLHVLTHDYLDHHAHESRDKRWEFLSFFAGIGLLFLVEHWVPGSSDSAAGTLKAGIHAHGDGENTFFSILIALFKETSPYLMLGLIFSGLIYGFLPQASIDWLRRGGSFRQSLKGMLFGLPLPVCSCGVLPLFTGLARRGAPTAALLAFLIATPELGIDSFLLSFKMLGLEFTLLRLIMAMILPIGIALLAVRILKAPVPEKVIKSDSCCAGKMGQESLPHKVKTHPHRQAQGAAHAHTHTTASEQKEEQPKSTKNWLHFAFVDMVNDLLPLVSFGLIIAALVEVLIPLQQLSPIFHGWDILLLGLLGIPFYVCASASVPLAMVLLERGFSTGAVLVFLFAGPATNVTTILALNKVFGPKSGWKVAGIALVLAAFCGLFVNSFYSANVMPPALHDSHSWTFVEILSAGSLSLLGLFSLYRLGPLHWISTVVNLIPGFGHHPKNG